MFNMKRKLYEQRIDSFLPRLKHLFYEDMIKMTAEFCRFDGFVSFENRLNGKYEEITEGTVWGKDWQRAWFHLKGFIPEEWIGKHVCARINLGGEVLIFNEQGIPIQGLSVHSIWFNYDYRRDRFEITKEANGGENVDLWMEASAGQLFGLPLKVEEGLKKPDKYGSYDAKVNEISLLIFRKDIWDLYLDFMVLNNQMRTLPEKNVRRNRILYALNEVMNGFRGDKENIEELRNILKPELVKEASASNLNTIAVGHAHLDTAWLWPLSETIRKCGRTFANQVGMIEKYPGYIFGASQAQHYAFVKEYYRGLYEKIKEKVNEDRWEIQGGMWVEADCNLISGESLVRQILHGKLFFKEEFDIDVKNLWLPDVFGYSAAMPQILKKSGLHYMVTQKISWSQFNKFPHHTFRWRGIDGTEILTHFPPEDNYCSELMPEKLKYAEENFNENYFMDSFLTLYGIGDGGGGPTEEIIETGLRQQNMEGSPRVIFGKAQDFLNSLNEYHSKLPVWVGELYLELHRGTLTTQVYNKKMNRFMENKLREVEMFYSSLPLDKYPMEQLDAMWKTVLLNQFHDIIPGSSITPVYEESRSQYENLKKQGSELLDKVGMQLFTLNEDALCLVNTLSFETIQCVKLPGSWLGYDILDSEGKLVPLQLEGQEMVIYISVPALGSVTLKRGKKFPLVTPVTVTGGLILENAFIRYEFSERGTIIGVYDKEINREILSQGMEGNMLKLYEDRPVNWDAWDIDIYYEDQLLQTAKLESWEWIAQGPVRQGIRFLYSVGNSAIEQKVYLSEFSRRLDFETHVDWKEDHKLLRVEFEVDIHSEEAVFDIQFGNLKRKTHRNTSWEAAKFEVVGHRFADLSDDRYGVAILNDCKYGYSVKDNKMGLSLLRAASMPDPFADRGEHEFTYSFLPHAGCFMQSNVLKEAQELNRPLSCFEGYEAKGFKFPFTIDTHDIVLEVIKKAEKQNAVIVRLYEPLGKRGDVVFQLNKAGMSVYETDLMENIIKKLETKEEILSLEFSPFEIKTLLICSDSK